MDMFVPNYTNYRKILKIVKKSGKYKDYIEAKNAKEFIILRHDIEFSIDRAYTMSQIEYEEDISTTYFVQLTSNAYNSISEKNRKILKQMIRKGHHIGLHYHLGDGSSMEEMRCRIKWQADILSEILEKKVDRFSIHRPTEESRYYEIEVEGLINAYSKEYFTHFVKGDTNFDLEVKYIADSKHQWNYGVPDEITIQTIPKIQLLIHPYSWTVEGGSALDTFHGIATEKELDILETFENETKIFKEIKDKIFCLRGI